MSSAKRRPFCLGLNVLSLGSIGVMTGQDPRMSEQATDENIFLITKLQWLFDYSYFLQNDIS